MRAGPKPGVGTAIVWGSFSTVRQSSRCSHTGAKMRVTCESTGAVSRMQQVIEPLKSKASKLVIRSPERAGRLKGQSAGAWQ